MSSNAVVPVKRFKGAPFGIQTARFDVSSLHPKFKTAGSYTEIPYDKNYMNDLPQSDKYIESKIDIRNKDIFCTSDLSNVFKQKSTNGQHLIYSYLKKNKCEHVCKVNGQTVKRSKNINESRTNNRKLNFNSLLMCQAFNDKKFHNSCLLDSAVESHIIKTRHLIQKYNKFCFINRTFFQEKTDKCELLRQPITDQPDYVIGEFERFLTSQHSARGNINTSSVYMPKNHNANSNKQNSEDPEPDTNEEILDTENITEDLINVIRTSDESGRDSDGQSIIYEYESNKSSIPAIEIESEQVIPIKSALSKTKKMDEITKRVSFESKLKKTLHDDFKQTASLSSGRSSVDDNLLIEAEHRRQSSVRFSASRKMSLTDKPNVTVDQDILERASMIMKSRRASELVKEESVQLQNLESCSTDEKKSLPELTIFARSYINEIVASVKSSISEDADTVSISRSPAIPDEPQEQISGRVSEELLPKSETPLSMQKASSDDSADMVHNESLAESSLDNKEEQVLIQKAESEDLSISVPPNSVCYVEEIKNQSTKRKKTEKLMKIPYESCDTFLKRKLGPGVYNLMITSEEEKKTDQAAKTGWARQLELEKLAALPHLLYKEQWEEKKMLQKKLGPGSYNIKDFIEMNNSKPRSGRGICDNLAPRFENKLMSVTPGPGTYGVDGIPQRAMEIKDKKSASTKGILDAGNRKRYLPSVGSHLGPGTYNQASFTEQLLKKVTGVKGPYNTFTLDRNAPIITGHFAAVKQADLGPGQYDLKSFVDELNSEHTRTHGRFAKVDQYPEISVQDFPGPGTYDLKNHNKKCSHGVNIPGFLSSAKRDDKISQKFFSGNYNPVGAGRYDVQKYDEAQDVNGCTSAFKSRTNRPNKKMSQFLQERLQPKNINPEDRIKFNDPYKLTRSITIM